MSTAAPTQVIASSVTLSVNLSGDMTISNAAAQRHSLLAAVAQASGQGLALDLAQVEALDSSGIQLLIATRKSLQACGRTLHITQANSAVQDTLAVYGLQGWLTGENA
jgi:anti-anti-sigma factor